MADLVLKVQGIAKEPDTVSADQEVDEIFKVNPFLRFHKRTIVTISPYLFYAESFHSGHYGHQMGGQLNYTLVSPPILNPGN